jgi:hypothetical protein
MVGIGLGIVAVAVLAILFWGRPVRWFFLPDHHQSAEAERRRRRLRARLAEGPATSTVRQRRLAPWRTKSRRRRRDS